MKLHDILSEGLIKLPQRLLEAGDRFVVETCLGLIASHVASDSRYRIFEYWADQTYPGYKISEVNLADDNITLKLPKPTAEDFDVRYRKMFIMDSMIFAPTLIITHTLSRANGVYQAVNKTIIISSRQLERLIEGIDTNTILTSVLQRAHELIERMRTTYKHELTHYVQYVALQWAHDDQVKTNREPEEDYKSADDYQTSPIEFDPKIVSAIGYTLNAIRRRRQPSDQVIKAIAARVTQSDSGAPNPELSDVQPLDFFVALKKRSPAKWKLAVKKFYTELTNRLHQ